MEKKGASMGAIRAMQNASACHQNALEAFVFWGVAVALAKACGVPDDVSSTYADVWVLCRVLYTLVYLTPLNKVGAGSIRSLIFATGTFASLGLMWRAMRA
jgi:uncharacterized MAPEG superfamily protein